MHPAFGLLLGYLLGSIPFAYLAGKLTRGIDLREHGSGNLGATNVYRTLGAKIAGVVLALINGAGATSNSPTTALDGFSGAVAGGRQRDPFTGDAEQPDRDVLVGLMQEAADKCTQDIVKKEQELVQGFRDRGKEVLEVDRTPLTPDATLVVLEVAYRDGGPPDRYLVPRVGNREPADGEIERLNALDTVALSAGQKLRVPVSVERYVMVSPA